MKGGPERKRPRFMSIVIVPTERIQSASSPGGGETPLGLGAKLTIFRNPILACRRLPTPRELKERFSKRPPGGDGAGGVGREGKRERLPRRPFHGRVGILGRNASAHPINGWSQLLPDRRGPEWGTNACHTRPELLE